MMNLKDILPVLFPLFQFYPKIIIYLKFYVLIVIIFSEILTVE